MNLNVKVEDNFHIVKSEKINLSKYNSIVEIENFDHMGFKFTYFNWLGIKM